MNGTLLGQTKGSDTIVFLYDEKGNKYGFDYNGTKYYYIFNVQGDVIGILNQAGQKIVSYTYDPWGKVLSVPTAVEMLDQLSAVCKRFGVDYYAASQNQRDLLDSIALHEYQLKKAHEQGMKRSEVPPFLGLKRSDRSNDMPA